MSQECLIVIPARLASTRLPEKLLRVAGGKSVLRHTYESASQAKCASEVVVAVDDQRLADEVESFGGRWVMTSQSCASGTDRIAEVARSRPDIDVFVNVQGDEPEIEPDVIDAVCQALTGSSDADMSTAGTPIRDMQLLNDSSCVKIVMAIDSHGKDAEEGRAVYFSRAMVPFSRDGVDDRLLASEPPVYWHHLGLYAYRRDFLEWFTNQPPSLLEQIERLEQLRAIEAGRRIMVARVASATPGIDTQQDLEAFVRRIESS